MIQISFTLYIYPLREKSFLVSKNSLDTPLYTRFNEARLPPAKVTSLEIFLFDALSSLIKLATILPSGCGDGGGKVAENSQITGTALQ